MADDLAIPTRATNAGFRVVVFTLRFKRDVELCYFHGPALYALLLNRLGNPPDFPPGTSLWPVEHGHIRYLQGERYRFGLILHGDQGPWTPRWRELLALPPQAPNGETLKAPFGDTFTIESVRDMARPHIELPKHAEATRIDPRDIDVRRLGQTRVFTLRTRTPLYILRAPVHQKTHLFDQEHVDAHVIFERIRTAIESHFPGLPVPGTPPRGLRVVQNRLIRTDVSYPKKTLRGSSGTIVLEADEPLSEWALPLVLAGLVGIGKTTNMGQGRYTIDGVDLRFAWPPGPALNLVETATSPRFVEAARHAIRDAGPSAGVDGIDLDAFLDRMSFEEGRLIAKLRDGTYRPSPLKGVLIRRPDGRYRPIAVPTHADRFAQRMLLEVLRPALERVFEESSFAYRPSLSRRNAHRSVRQAYDQGYRWVLESDIAAFFDQVDWERLRIRLEAYLGNDPAVDLLMRWVESPIVFGDRTITRQSGLPQGSVVSPMLANLYLDAFDEAMASRGFRLVRYADDFLVLCKRQEDAERALEAVTSELADLGLAVKPDKTAVRSFDQGFKFLGAVFCRSVIIDVPRSEAHTGQPEVITDPEVILSDARVLEAVGDSAGWIRGLTQTGPQQDHERRWRAPVPPPVPDRRPVYVVDRTARLSGRHQGLWVERDGARPELVSWRAIRGISLLGGHRITTSVMQQALRNKVPIFFHRRDGTPTGSLMPDGVASPSPRTVRQWALLSRPAAGIAPARAIIEAKIHNVRLLVRRQKDPPQALLDMLANLAAAALRADSLDRLRGLEGQAAHAYFRAWSGWLAPFKWDGRSGRGATDPINAVLNILYTQLHRRTHQAIIAAGLDPYLGILHEGRSRYASLAADLMEPFRFLVDRVVLRMVHHGRLSPADFTRSEKSTYPLTVKEPAMRLILESWESALGSEVGWADRKASFDRHLFHQAESFGLLVEGERAELDVFRMKW